MPRLAPKPLQLDEMERQQLQQLVNRHSTPQQIAKRSHIILLADLGHNHREIARSLNISRDMATLWRERWLASSQKDIPVVERLQDAERPGAPATFSLEQILQLFAIACENPQTYGRPISHWTPRELALEVVKQGYNEPRHFGLCRRIEYLVCIKNNLVGRLDQNVQVFVGVTMNPDILSA